MALNYGLTLVTAPTEEPVTVLEAKKQVELPLSQTNHDEHLLRLITAARRYTEQQTNRQICTAVWDLYMDRFPCAYEPIHVPLPPLQSVVITYVDTAGTTQTWSSSDYVVSTSREPAIIRPAYGDVYPTPRSQPDAVKVRLTAGYGAATACPEELKAAMLLLLAHWFEHRMEVITGTIQTNIDTAAAAILEHYRVGDEFTKYGGRELEAY